MLNKFRRDERGAALIMVALTMVVLLGITAFVVDLGMGYNERRLSQTAADGAALAGAQFLGISQAVATAEAIEVARENLRADFTDTEWTALWATSAAPANGCPSSAPSGYVFGPGTKCVMFNSAGTRVRVRIPDQILETAFAGVLGEDEIRASAWAEAQITQGGTGGVLPFGILASSGGGQESCLKSGPSGHDGTDPCNGPDSGNFGSLDSPLYGNNPDYGTPTKCSGDTNGRLVSNIVRGIDHNLDEYQETPSVYDTIDTAGGSEPNRLDDCTESPSPGNYPYRPNTLVTQTGVGSNLDTALIRTDNAPYVGGKARLRRTDSLGAGVWPTRTVTGKTGVDDKPLWEFIDPALDSQLPDDCKSTAFTGMNASKVQLIKCFTAYNLLTADEQVPLFSLDSDGDQISGDPDGDGVYDIQKSPRFAFVPEFHASSFGSGTSQLAIKNFRAAYIQTLFFKCNGSSCDVTFNPGETGSGLPGASNKEVDSITALIFKDSMLPQKVLESGPGGTLNGAKVGLVG